MRALLPNVTVVAVEAKPWSFNGRTGVRHAIYVRGEGQSEASAAQIVKVTPEQMTKFSQGDVIDALPVDIFANTVEYQGVITGAKSSVSLDPSYVPAQHAKPRAVANS